MSSSVNNKCQFVSEFFINSCASYFRFLSTSCSLIQDRLMSSGLLRHSDQFCTDKSGNTLLMVAAVAGSIQSMKFLLSQRNCPVNAQHQKVACTTCSCHAVLQQQR